MKEVLPTTRMKWHWSSHPNNLKEGATYVECLGTRNKIARKIGTSQIKIHTRTTMGHQKIQQQQ